MEGERFGQGQLADALLVERFKEPADGRFAGQDVPGFREVLDGLQGDARRGGDVVHPVVRRVFDLWGILHQNEGRGFLLNEEVTGLIAVLAKTGIPQLLLSMEVFLLKLGVLGVGFRRRLGSRGF